MNTDIEKFCGLIRKRSKENQTALRSFSSVHSVLSPAFSILRQELDSMVRVIYLLSIADLYERYRLVNLTLSGKQWRVLTHKGKWKKVTDRDMVDLAQQLQGWTQSVYKFGCAFVHLSDFHNHSSENPFEKLEKSEQQDVLSHMRYYHGGPLGDNLTMEELSHYLPDVLKKISGNLECYLQQLEEDETIDEC
ncbi:MAG: hypothetical protein ACL93V_01395 [Candidatus Electrothrix sp. YB6]